MVGGKLQSLHAQRVVFTLEGIHHLLASLVAQCHQLVISFGICGSSLMMDVGDVILRGKQAQLCLQEFLGGLVGSLGDSILQTLGHGVAILGIVGCKGHGTADGILHQVVGVLLGRLQHGSQYLHRLWCRLCQ